METIEDAKKRYKKKNVKAFKFECYRSTEADIIEKLQSVPNRAGYIKNLVRQDIENNK